MRFGLDVAQQRVSWDELVRRVQLAEELGFDGVWGFDHFQPMYGDGPGETFEAMTYLAALAGITSPSTGERFDLLEDSLEIATRLFTGEVVDYDGKRVSLHHAQLQPPPV